MQQYQKNDLENGVFSDQGLRNKLIVYDKQECIFLEKTHIIHAEAEGAYTRIFLKDGSNIMISKNLKALSEKLKDPHFIRPHKSHLVNCHYIAKYIKGDGGYLVLENNRTVPVAIRKKADLMKLMEMLTV